MGGRGGTSIIPSLVSNPDIKLTSIVNAYDDGKSTGEIRDFFNMLGPSDIRKVQVNAPFMRGHQCRKRIICIQISK